MTRTEQRLTELEAEVDELRCARPPRQRHLQVVGGAR